MGLSKGHQRPSRDTTGLTGAPPALQGHLGPVRGITVLSGPRDTSGLAGAPQACQGYHRSSRGTTGLAGAPWACQGPHRPRSGTTGLAGAPPASQASRHHAGRRGTLGLSGASRACWGHPGLFIVLGRTRGLTVDCHAADRINNCFFTCQWMHDRCFHLSLNRFHPALVRAVKTNPSLRNHSQGHIFESDGTNCDE